MKKTLFGLCMVAVLAFAGPAQGQYISSINGADIATSYDAASGVLTLSDTLNVLVVQYDDNTQDSFENVTFDLTTTLSADNSMGYAMGLFTGGSFSMVAADSTVLLSGVVQDMSLEGLGGGNLLGGNGVVTLDAGSLKGAIAPGYDYGDIVSLLFNLDLGPINDFSGDFSGAANLTILPIPEPATMLLLGLGGCGLLRRNRR